jgi:alpha-D-ribose 1-methylphosphonate 5-triphosphate diphosphatase
MLLSPYKLRDEINLPIEKGFEMITSIPAKLIGLNDRGTISKAKLADIIVVDESFYPRVVFTVKKGNIIYNSYDLKSTYKKIFSIT